MPMRCLVFHFMAEHGIAVPVHVIVTQSHYRKWLFLPLPKQISLAQYMSVASADKAQHIR